MESLLIGGAPNVGKTRAIYKITEWLINNKGFSIIEGFFPPQMKDFRVVLEGKNKNNNPIRIIINSPTDDKNTIDNFKSFFDLNGNYDVLISSVRDLNFERDYFFNTMMSNLLNTNFVLEIPLAKITRRDPRFGIALNWYKNQIDNLLQHTIQTPPFNI